MPTQHNQLEPQTDHQLAWNRRTLPMIFLLFSCLSSIYSFSLHSFCYITMLTPPTQQLNMKMYINKEVIGYSMWNASKSV